MKNHGVAGGDNMVKKHWTVRLKEQEAARKRMARYWLTLGFLLAAAILVKIL